ncbi:Rrf2 family transcriptional regulator [Pseudomonas sp.]|uniref:RrF2 family transcriptional regulator n=1 Tax=Pseudomonas sp. TaxID=306 RepID=UPI002489EE60|nr:Rrf2 family transcriptional regulator [Pseudomonas sp.]MDI1332490.1 Rrf2 family transcriptional regulator [Pseudomonas sp.]
MSLYSAGVEYGIHCLIFLVGNGGATREASVRDLADLQGVPQDYLAKIFTKLAKAKLLVATEGFRGGFKLARPSDEITILDIVKAIDGQKLIFDCREIRGRCALFEGSPPAWALEGGCAVHIAMMSAQSRMEEALAQQTILDLARKVRRKSPEIFSAQVDDWINDRKNKNGSNVLDVVNTSITVEEI